MNYLFDPQLKKSGTNSSVSSQHTKISVQLIFFNRKSTYKILSLNVILVLAMPQNEKKNHFSLPYTISNTEKRYSFPEVRSLTLSFRSVY